MTSLWFYRDPIDRLHQEVLERERQRHFIAKAADHRAVEWQAQDALLLRLQQLDLQAYPTANNSPFDLWVEGVKVELKASHWHEPGRYQANIRNHKADFLIFDCINGTDHFHIIPMAAIAPRKAIAVWSYDPADSSGQWVQFLENWDHLIKAVETAAHIWQPPLF
jgi:hypothetical protein